MELKSGDKTQPQTPADPDTLETIDEKIVGLIDEVDDPKAHSQLQDARDELDLHRQARGLPSGDDEY